MRRRMNRKKDRKVFRGTANKSRTINLRPVTMRGGIRL